jgi:hypothetical protein
LFDAIWLLEEQTQIIQLQLSQLKNNTAATTAAATEATAAAECQCVEPNHCQNLKLLPKYSSSQWELTITSNNRGIHLQTSIRSMSDLSAFLKEAFSVFVYDQEIDRNFSETGARQSLTVTNKMMHFERLVYNMFSNRSSQTLPPQNISPKVLMLIDQNKTELLSKQMRFLKLQMIKTYFNCHALMNPVLIHSYHYPILCQDPDSLLSTAMAAVVAYSSCVHIDLDGFPFTREQLAEACRLQAREMLQDVLFESEPCIELCLALWLTCFSSLHGLKSAEARFQSSICWHMIIQLKSTYANRKQFTTKEEAIKAEVWKRLFYIVRFLEFNMRMLYDGTKELSSFSHHLEVGLPTPLPCESLDDQLTRAVLCFKYTFRLTINSAGLGKDNEIELAGLGLLAGTIDSIPSNILQYFEYNLLHMWDSIPVALRLGSGPYQLMDPTCVEACRDPCILRFNVVFYIYWMNLQSRLMQSPHKTNLTAAAFNKMDGDRAILIASICSNAATQLFKALSAVMPCAIELHWITMCVDLLKLLSTAANIHVRERAERDHRVLSRVLEDKLSGIGDNSTYAYASQAPYLSYIKNLITSHICGCK